MRGYMKKQILVLASLLYALTSPASWCPKLLQKSVAPINTTNKAHIEYWTNMIEQDFKEAKEAYKEGFSFTRPFTKIEKKEKGLIAAIKTSLEIFIKKNPHYKYVLSDHQWTIVFKSK